MVNHPDKVVLSIKDSKKPLLFSVHMEQKPSLVSINNVELKDSSDYQYDGKKLKLNVKISEVKDGDLVILK
jgi:hypothetical protein